jgi:hypothetical protein
MDTLLFSRSTWMGLFAAAVLLLAARPVRAEAPPEPPGVTAAAPVFAENSLRQFFTSSGSRDRVIQLSVLCMALALFILMKKFTPDASRVDGLKTRSTEDDAARDRSPKS